jgi:uroporphyrinogen-III synthase
MLASRMSPAAVPRVWITRAEPGASATARRVAAAGLVPLVAPLLETADLAGAAAALDALPPSAVLAFTSANGVRAFARLTPRRGLKVWCVGAATAGAARLAGFVDLVVGGGDVEALARVILEAPAAAEIIHASALEPAGDLVGRLASAGRPARRIAVYASREARPAPARLQVALGAESILVHSPRAARILADILRERPGPGPRVVGLSPACLAPLASLDLAGMVAPASPLESDLINLLTSPR